MNFLQIAKRVRQEMGASGDGPASVVGQTGHMAKIVSWVLSAHEEVQQVFADWNFNWAEYAGTLDPGEASVDPRSKWALEFNRLVPDSVYVNGTMPVFEVEWENFRHLQPTTGAPQVVSAAPDRTLRFWPAPQVSTPIRIEYLRRPQIMSDNQDEPRLDPELHMAIVWRAVMFGCAHDENGNLFQSAAANYRGIVSKMAVEEMPQLTLAGALA